MENELIEVEIAPVTLEKRKRGGQPGNTNALHHGAPRGNANALVHGFYSILNRNPYSQPLENARRLSSPRLGSPAYASEYIFRTGLKFVKEINQTLALFAPHMLLAATGEELMQWLRPMIKLMRARQRLIRSMFSGSYHDRALFTLSHDPIQWVNLEFKDRDLREYPIIPPPDYDNQCRSMCHTCPPWHRPPGQVGGQCKGCEGTVLSGATAGSAVEGLPEAISSENGIPTIFKTNSKDNTIIPPSGLDSFVQIYFLKSRGYHVSHNSQPLPSPFLTDHQWLGIENSFLQFQKLMDSDRRRKRKTTAFPARLHFQAMLIKLAFKLSWKDLPGFIKIIHPDLPLFPHWTCQLLYRDLYNSGFLQGMFKQLYSHFSLYSGTSLKELVKQGCFQANDKSVFLAPGVPLNWQTFTALLLLQRGYHNYRAVRPANSS